MGNQVESLKKYLRRLGAGEDLEKVRKDFAVEFQDVDATVIMKAEQEMLTEGTPLSEYQECLSIWLIRCFILKVTDMLHTGY